MRSAFAALLPLALLSYACGGGAPASVPPQLVLPFAPDTHAAQQGHCPKVPSSSPPTAAATFEPFRPPAVKFPVTPAAQAIVDASDREDADKKLDAGRHPAELLSFLDLKPGARVAELIPGGGYTTELLARAVGPKGKVWGVNNAIAAKFADKRWAARLGKPVMKNVVRVDKELDAPFPPDAKNLDAVVIVLFYHDAVWMGVERDRMNRAVFDALKHGGQYVVVDHSAREGAGTADVKTTHRIDELFVTREIERAGFHEVAGADFLRNPADTRDWNDSPSAAGDRRGTSDRFVLKFIKP
jgi:predicted methyltransferase